jgi:hypothetical protein
MVMVSLFSLQFAKAGDNEITLDQAGDGFSLNILQKGHSNTIKRYDTGSRMLGTDLEFDFRQVNTGSGNSENVINNWHLNGNDNKIIFGQGIKVDDPDAGTWLTSDGTTGGHYVMFDIHGNDNTIAGYQDGSNQTANIYAWGNNKDIWVEQYGGGEHTAYVQIQGTEPVSADLEQSASTDQTYSMTINCVTVGGCSVAVTQN